MVSEISSLCPVIKNCSYRGNKEVIKITESRMN